MKQNTPIPKTYSHFKQSAVMILLDNKGRLILTKRSRKLRSHKGQFSFPGGKREPTDKDYMETAIRETEEEIGIKREWVENIQPLSSSYSPRGFVIHPFIGYLKDKTIFKKSADEVEKIVRIPFKFFQNTIPTFRIYKIHGVRIRADFYHFGSHVIWGATARMISLLKKTGISKYLLAVKK